jgi:hypothetical protein
MEGITISAGATCLVLAMFEYGIKENLPHTHKKFKKNLKKKKAFGGATSGAMDMATTTAKWLSETKQSTPNEHTRNKLWFAKFTKTQRAHKERLGQTRN